MPSTNLAELLTGKALDIPIERLDMQGLVAAFRMYREALPDERQRMEIGLAEAILSFDSWGFIVDAVYLARTLGMAHELLRTAINYASLMSPERYRNALDTEVRRYIRDVPQRDTFQPGLVISTSTADAWEAIGEMSGVGSGTADSFLSMSSTDAELPAVA